MWSHVNPEGSCLGYTSLWLASTLALSSVSDRALGGTFPKRATALDLQDKMGELNRSQIKEALHLAGLDTGDSAWQGQAKETVNAVYHEDAPQGFLFMKPTGEDEDGHAIGIFKAAADDLYCFEPNYGLFGYAALKDLRSDLHDAHVAAATRKGWLLFPVSRLEGQRRARRSLWWALCCCGGGGGGDD